MHVCMHGQCISTDVVALYNQNTSIYLSLVGYVWSYNLSTLCLRALVLVPKYWSFRELSNGILSFDISSIQVEL